MKTCTWTAQLTVASSKAQHYLNSLCTTPKRPPSTSKFYVDFKKMFFKDQKIETHLLFLDVLRLVRHFFELKNSRVRSFYLSRTHSVHRTAFFLHTSDFSLSKVTALKVVWGKDTSRRIKEPGIDPRVSRRGRHFANVGDVIIYPDLVVARTDKGNVFCACSTNFVNNVWRNSMALYILTRNREKKTVVHDHTTSSSKNERY